MPVGKPTNGRELRALAIALGGVVMAVVVGWLMLRVSRSSDVKVRLGDEVFDAGQIGRISKELADRGPVLYSDVSGGDRDIYLNHLGAVAEEGWVAFAARPDDVVRPCTLFWIAELDRFELFEMNTKLRAGQIPERRCGDKQYAADGVGLVTYPVTIRAGHMYIDFNAEAHEKSQQPATTVTVVESGSPKSSS